MNKLLIPLLVFIGISMNVFTQDKSNRESRGDKYYTNYSFDKAIYSYTHTKHLSLDGQRRLAESYYNIDLTDKSEAEYSKILSSSENISAEDYYNYAMVLRSNGKYYESGMWMNKFVELKPNDYRAKDYIANSKELNNLLRNNDNYLITSLKFNNDALDFGPSYYKDKIVFASTMERGRLISRRYNWTRKPFWNLYVSELDGVQLKKPKIFAKNLNGKLHDGPASFNNDGTFMAFTRNHYKDKSKDNVVELQIQFSSFINGKWTKPEPFFLNNESYSVGHPCLTRNGKTMYFTSDMPGGFGKADIYRITKNEKGEWGEPENLGDKINTEGDEMFPFLDETSNILFFSSNGRFGLGGLDIFVYSMNDSGFGRAFNVGYPLNTRYDDFAAIVDFKQYKGYFTSNRSGGRGGDDIYSLAFKGFPKDTVSDLDVKFTVNSPGNIPTERRMRETFPLRNYIYFNKESSEIPDRYVLLNKGQVKDFKEEQLEVFSPKDLTGRSKRQMIAYYNILNILGDRMNRDLSSNIILVGSSEKGPQDGQIMAESVKKYLLNIFKIKDSRIGIEGRDKPKIPSEQPGGTKDLDLLREGDRRVSIESNSPAMLMEFQSGPDAPLKPVEIIAVQEAPLDSYVTFNVEGADKALSSWSLVIKDENGIIQNYGPFYQEQISLPGKSIMGTRPEGNFNVTMIGLAKNGKTIRKEVPVHMNLWAPPKDEEGMRFSIIFEFDDSRAIKIYEKYLTEIVTPKIPKNGKVIIHGHTDITGDENHNQKLSSSRANEALTIIKNSLANAGRTDVKFEVYAFGENQDLAPFENNSPEGRAYNRTVIIDIIPGK
jgi:outer membrane protein OmpA-like peptidoglycan-associated protein